MRKTAEKKPTMLDAVCWKARQLGISYGKLSARLTEAELADVYAEYEKILLERQELERLRLEHAAMKKKAQNKSRRRSAP